MAETLMAIVNVLLIPFISLFILYKRNHNTLGTRLETFMKYAILVVVVSLVTETVAYAVWLLFEIVIDAYTSYYTVIATATALVIPFVVRAVKVKVEYTKEKDTNGKKDEEKEPEEK